MIPRLALHFGLTVFLLAAIVRPTRADGPVKVVIVAGSNFYKVGEHDYLAGSAALANLLRQTPGIVPVLAVDWPKKPEETFAGAGPSSCSAMGRQASVPQRRPSRPDRETGRRRRWLGGPAPGR